MVTRILISLLVGFGIVIAGSLFDAQGNHWILELGIVAKAVLTGAIILLIPTGDYYFTFPAGTEFVFNIIFYSLITFIVLDIWRSRRDMSFGAARN